jgi:hypothetical protein
MTGVLGLLTVLFVALRLTGVIDWSWWWVLAPIWGEVVLMLGVALAAKASASYLSRRYGP